MRWLHSQYTRKLKSTLGTKDLELKVSFCAKQKVDVQGIINALKVRQSPHNLHDTLSGLLYHSSCHSVFHFSNEVEIDRAIRSSLSQFNGKYDG